MKLAAGTKQEKMDDKSQQHGGRFASSLCYRSSIGDKAISACRSLRPPIARHLVVLLGPGAHPTWLAGPIRSIPIAIRGRRPSDQSGSTASATSWRAGLAPRTLGKIPVVICALIASGAWVLGSNCVGPLDAGERAGTPVVESSADGAVELTPRAIDTVPTLAQGWRPRV